MLVYKLNDEPVDTPKISRGSKWIFVLSTSKKLYVGQKRKGRFQYSSFLAGGATSATERLVVNEGVLKSIWPYSGHYLLTEENFIEFICFLEENRVNLDNVQEIRRRKSKKKVLRQAPGISSLALQEAQDIFGDVDELLILCKEGLRENGLDGNDEDASKSLEKEFEPSILAAKYMRPEDDDIRKEDVPERIQLSEKSIGKIPQSEDTVPEAKWIYEHMFGLLDIAKFEHIAKLDKEQILSEIANVLRLFHDHKFEVPFISMYRKEMCVNLLQNKEEFLKDAETPTLKMYKALWAVQKWDEKWLLLQRQKSALRTAYENRAYDVENDEIRSMVLDSILEALSEAKSERA